MPSTHQESGTFANFRGLPTRTAKLPNSIELCYVDDGCGVPIVFVHGLLGDWRSWEPQWNAFLEQGYRCLSYSRRYSFPNANDHIDPSQHSALVDAADLAGLLDALNIPAAILIGTSYGAFASLAFAVHHAQRVIAMVATEPPMMKYADFSAEGVALRAEFENTSGAAARALKRGDEESAVRMMTIAINGRQSTAANSEHALQRRMENANAMRALMLSTDPFPLLSPEQLRAIAVPTLLVAGERTQPMHDAIFRNVCAAMPQASAIRVRNAGHGVHRENPSEFNAIALAFLRRELTTNPSH